MINFTLITELRVVQFGPVCYHTIVFKQIGLQLCSHPILLLSCMITDTIIFYDSNLHTIFYLFF